MTLNNQLRPPHPHSRKYGYFMYLSSVTGLCSTAIPVLRSARPVALLMHKHYGKICVIPTLDRSIVEHLSRIMFASLCFFATAGCSCILSDDGREDVLGSCDTAQHSDDDFIVSYLFPQMASHHQCQRRMIKESLFFVEKSP